MKTIYFLFSSYTKILALISKKKAANFAFKLFQKTQPKKLNEIERKFYDETDHFYIDTEIGRAKVFEKGSENDEVIFIAHGWNSNAGSMALIADVLVAEGYHCILVDFPGHGSSTLKYSNLKINKDFMKAVLRKVSSDKPINIIGHSFGTLISPFALSELSFKVNKLVYLSPPNELNELFLVLKEMLSLSDTVFQEVVFMAEELLQESIDQVSVLKKSKLVDYQQLTIMHDRYDKILPLTYSELLANQMDRSNLFIYERIGHTRMLWNEGLLTDLRKVMSRNPKSAKAEKLVAERHKLPTVV